MIDLLHGDCMVEMQSMLNDSVDFTLTDIPYNVVNRKDNGLRTLDKGNADVLTFDLESFLDEVYRVTKNSICIFCGKEQFSDIYKYFANKQGTTRPIVWQKSNPSPMNGQYIYLSGVEFAVWLKSGEQKYLMHIVKIQFLDTLTAVANYIQRRRITTCYKSSFLTIPTKETSCSILVLVVAVIY